MSTERNVKAEIETLNLVGQMVETYEVVAATSIRRIRFSVLAAREFHDGLLKTFREFLRSYRLPEAEALIRREGRGGGSGKMVRRMLGRTSSPPLHARAASSSSSSSANAAHPASGSKTVYVVLSANTGLYGDVIERTFSYFFNIWRRNPADVVIIGKMGAFLFDEAMPGALHTVFSFPDNRIDVDNLSTITLHLSNYDRVVVFYPIFKNFLTQQPVSLNITGEEPFVEGDKEAEKILHFLFEPAPRAILAFFKTEIFASLLEQTMQDARLSRQASRMTLLDRATANVKRALTKTTFAYQQMHHRTANRKQLEAIGGAAFDLRNHGANK